MGPVSCAFCDSQVSAAKAALQAFALTLRRGRLSRIALDIASAAPGTTRVTKNKGACPSALAPSAREWSRGRHTQRDPLHPRDGASPTRLHTHPAAVKKRGPLAVKKRGAAKARLKATLCSTHQSTSVFCACRQTRRSRVVFPAPALPQYHPDCPKSTSIRPTALCHAGLLSARSASA